MSILRKILTLGGNETYNRAMELYNRASYQEAIQAFEKVARGDFGEGRLYPRLALFYTGQAYRNLGLIDMHEGRFVEAIPKFEKASSLIPANPELHAYLGICYNNQGRYEDAIREFFIVVREGNDSPSGCLRLSLVYLNAGRHEEAMQWVGRAIAREPDHADLHYLRGMVLSRKRNYADSSRAFQEAVRLNPNYFEAQTKLAYSYVLLGDLPRAKEAFHRAMALSPANEAIKEGLRLLEEGTQDKESLIPWGEEAFSRAMMIDPMLADILMVTRKSERDIGFYHTLVRIYEKVLKQNPKYADVHYGLGHAYHELGQWEEAIAHYEAALAINPRYLDAQRSLEEARKRLERFRRL